MTSPGNPGLIAVGERESEGPRTERELPLQAASGGRPALDRLDPDAYDPFHLIVADTWSAQVLSWDGIRTSRISLGKGTHAISSGASATGASQVKS